MKFRVYLEARGETVAAFARRARLPQTTVSLIYRGGGTRVETAAKIVQACMQAPAPDGSVVTYEDLIPTDNDASDPAA